MCNAKVYVLQNVHLQQVRGLSTQGCDNSLNESNTQSQTDSNTPVRASTPTQHDSTSFKADDTPSSDGSNSNFLTSATMATSSAGNSSHTVTPVSQNPNSSNFVNMEHSEALQHLEKALSACEATLTETQGMVKMEPDEQFTQQQQDKPYSISMVPSSNCNPGSPFPAIEGVQLFFLILSDADIFSNTC